MALPAQFLEELRQRVPMAELVGRRVRLARSGRTVKGCCPFHGEKTPSFYVYEDHYHCFGCGAHGDCMSYVMQTEGLSFPEAVEELSASVGLRVPKDEATSATRATQKALGDILSDAQGWFRRWLSEPTGQAARAYLAGRGLSEATIAGFGLGWSGPGRGALAQALGVPIGALVDAGLMYRREEDGIAVDFYRDRIMFPIADQAGRVMSFGGRTMGDGQPKYINGPETPLYAKRRTLYAMDKAREGLRMGHGMVLVEGYLDVIAMHQAGETGTIAPLGSALTDEQLDEMWRLSPAPVLCFDGDAAGRRACVHAMELALPKLAAQRTLKVAHLPDGSDPDSMLRSDGTGAMRAALAASLPLDQALALALRPDGDDFLALATWRNRLALAVDCIEDAATAQAYRTSLLNFYFDEVAIQWTQMT